MPSAFRRAGTTSSEISTSLLSSGNTNTNNKNTSTVTRVSSITPSSYRLRGVKPWQGGSYLTSVGLNDLDSILGGGQVLGTSILLEEDRLWTRDLAITLVKYWCAEAISQEQHLVIPIFSKSTLSVSELEDSSNLSSLSFMLGENTSISSDDEVLFKNIRDDLGDILSALPRNLHWDKHKKREEKEKREQEGSQSRNKEFGSSLGPITILEEEEEENEEAEEHKADDGLEIAWQYKKSIQQEHRAHLTKGTAKNLRSSSATSAIVTNVFCHSYDLSGRMVDQTPVDIHSFITQLSCSSIRTCCSHTKAFKLFNDLVGLLKEKVLLSAHDGTGKAVRLLLYHPPMETLAIALPLLLAHIRKESLPVVIMICTKPNIDVKSCIRLARSCDVVLSTEGFASRRKYPPPPEFRHLQGVLKISKTTRKRTEIAASIFGFKRDRRKLHIPLLHIPPEDYAEGGGSVGAGGVRSGAGRPAGSLPESDGAKPSRSKSGMGCSSSGSGSALDF